MVTNTDRILRLIDPQLLDAMTFDPSDPDLTLGQLINDLPIEKIRDMFSQRLSYWNKQTPQVDRIVDLKVDGSVGKIPVRLYYPSNQQKNYRYLYMYMVVDGLKVIYIPMMILCVILRLMVMWLSLGLIILYRLNINFQLQLMKFWQY